LTGPNSTGRIKGGINRQTNPGGRFGGGGKSPSRREVINKGTSFGKQKFFGGDWGGKDRSEKRDS